MDYDADLRISSLAARSVDAVDDQQHMAEPMVQFQQVA